MGKQNLITFELAAISGILMSILVSMFAFRQFSLPVSQADLGSTRAGLELPYLRVQALPVEPGADVVKVEVLTNTGGASVLGADIVIEYDERIITTSKEQIQSSGALDTLNVNSIEAGNANFSVFASRIANEEPVMTNADQEMPIATVEFSIVDNTVDLTQLRLRFVSGSLDESNLILEEEPRPEFPTDILKGVEGTIISL